MGDLEEEKKRARSCRDLNKKIKIARKFAKDSDSDNKQKFSKDVAYKLEMKKREDC